VSFPKHHQVRVQVDPHHFLPVGQVKGFDADAGRENAGVQDQHIQPAETPGQRFESLQDCLFIGQIALQPR
jgi:hypothetical protein